MRFRIKMTLSMLCLLSLIFGIGGSALISISFQTALEREKESAKSAYHMILNTLQVINDIDIHKFSSDMTNILEQIYSQSNASWYALRLKSSEDIICEVGSVSKYLDDFSNEIQPDHCLISHFKDSQGEQYLQLSGTFSMGEETLFLDTAYKITPIYDTRQQQLEIYQKVFLAMVAACAILAYSISWFLTRPLSRLSVAANEIASGNLSYRSKIAASDEIGSLSTDFDTMAEKVEDSFQQLKLSMERQERFMGSFAHELKTPMTSIIGYADLIRTETLIKEELIDAAQYIFSEGKRLESLSIKLLEIIVAGKNDIKFMEVSPSYIISDLVEHLRPGFQKEQITIQYRCDEGTCNLEPDLVKSLLVNLIENARKALDHGGKIIVLSKMLPDGCMISVADNGKGMPKEAIEHLTEAFYRVDKSRARQQGGVGLGLSLCDKIAQIHNGNIKFESFSEKGTCVTVELRGGRK